MGSLACPPGPSPAITGTGMGMPAGTEQVVDLLNLEVVLLTWVVVQQLRCWSRCGPLIMCT